MTTLSRQHTELIASDNRASSMHLYAPDNSKSKINKKSNRVCMGRGGAGGGDPGVRE